MPIDPEWLRQKYVDEERTTKQIADLLGCTCYPVHKALKRHGIPTRRTGPFRGERHPDWRGGIRRRKNGYIWQHAPDHPDSNPQGYVWQHRLVMEQMIGRRLSPMEVVHHKDDNTSNNDPSNLELFQSNGEHLSRTLRGKKHNMSPEGRARIRAAKRVELPIDEIREMYETMSSREIAKRFGCGEGPVRARLREAGVPILSYKERQAKRAPWPPAAELAQQLKSESSFVVAARIGRNQMSMLAYLRRSGVDPRALKRSREQRHGRSQSSDHPCQARDAQA